MLDFFAQWKKHERAVVSYINDRVEGYYASDCYKKLKQRVDKLNDSIDMRFQGSERSGSGSRGPTWNSKFVVPLVREQYILRRATLKGNFRADPLFTLSPIGATPWENAQNMQDVLNNNCKRTRFRDKSLNLACNLAARWGTVVMHSAYHQTVEKYKKTSATQFGIDRVEMENQRHEVDNDVILPLNYFQNPAIADPDYSDFRGHISRIFLSELVEEVMLNRGVYVMDNLARVVEEIKRNPIKDANYRSGTRDEWKWLAVDIVNWWGTLNIEGNEDDQTIYHVQMAGDKVIRFQDNPYDENVIPYSVYNLDRRYEYWWGNTDAENVIPAENVSNLLMNVATDNALRQMEHYLFVDSRSGLSAADWQERRKNGGYIRFDGKGPQTARDYFYDYQVPELSLNALEYANRENKEAAQRITSKADLTRGAQQGGPQNKTATAAVIMDERGNVIEADLNSEFAFGVQGTGRINCILLQQFMPDQFNLTAGPMQSQRVVNKEEMLGQYDYELRTSYQINQQVRQTNLLNFMTALQNFKNVDPSWADIDIRKVGRKWAETYDLGLDIDEVIPEQPIMQGEVPSDIMMGQEMPGGPQPAMGPAQPGPQPAMPINGPRQAAGVMQ